MSRCPPHLPAVVALCALAACGAKEPAMGIAHGQPRPSCLSTIGAGRTPHLMPEVVGAGWSAPRMLGAAINTACPEDAIEVSPDGERLYFLWSPEVGAPADELLHGSTGTYVANRVGAGPGDFADPTFFSLRQGARDGAYDGEVSFSPAGDEVYFHSTRAENTGYLQSPPVDDPLDIYVATLVNGVPQAARNLGAPVNSTSLDGEHCLSPDGNRLFLTSTRPGGLGGQDIWVAERSGDGWTEPKNLGAPINSAHSDLQPAFAAGDSDTMYFVSDRAGAAAIWRARFDGSAWGAPERILTGHVGEPTLVEDGSVLYFVHVSVDDQGVFGSDVWYVERQ